MTVDRSCKKSGTGKLQKCGFCFQSSGQRLCAIRRIRGLTSPARLASTSVSSHVSTQSGRDRRSGENDSTKSRTPARRCRSRRLVVATVLRSRSCGDRSSFPRRDRCQTECIGERPYSSHVRPQLILAKRLRAEIDEPSFVPPHANNDDSNH